MTVKTFRIKCICPKSQFDFWGVFCINDDFYRYVYAAETMISNEPVFELSVSFTVK